MHHELHKLGTKSWRYKWLQWTALLAISWVLMTQFHEWGHIIGGYLSGGKLIALDVWPWHLPYSIFEPDPHPLVTLWSGLLVGIVAPFLLALLIRTDSAWFVSHFCWLANGSYIALAWISRDSYLDTTKLLEYGAPTWSIAFYCCLTIGVGYVGLKKAIRNLLKLEPAQSPQQS
jgi:hypothetical protein